MDAAVGVAACAGVASAEGMPRSAVVLAEGMASAVFGGGGWRPSVPGRQAMAGGRSSFSRGWAATVVG